MQLEVGIILENGILLVLLMIIVQQMILQYELMEIQNSVPIIQVMEHFFETLLRVMVLFEMVLKQVVLMEVETIFIMMGK